MKGVLITILVLTIGINAAAQVGGIQYNAYISGGQVQSNSSPQTYSVTAYSVDYWGNVQTMQIKVAIISSNASSYASRNEMRVVAQYVRYGYLGATWQEIPTQPIVYQCSPYTQDPLESRFMYKAMIGSDYVFFNL